MSQVEISPWLAHLNGFACKAGATNMAAAVANGKRLYLSFMEPSGIKVLLCSKGCSIANGKSLNSGHQEGPNREFFTGKYARTMPGTPYSPGFGRVQARALLQGPDSVARAT